jgi:ribokinase
VADERAGGAGPDPRRIYNLDTLARELGLLLARASAGSRSPQVTLADLTRRIGLPKATIHNYITGNTLAPADVLDKIVVALSAQPEEQREWSEAWFRVSAHRQAERRQRLTRREVSLERADKSVTDLFHERLRRTASRTMSLCTISAQNLDLIYQVELISVDHEEEIADAFECPGGSGANTTLALALLGARTAIVGVIADDRYGRMLADDLTAAGVDKSFVITIAPPGHTGHTLVFTDGGGRRLIYVRPGVNELMAEELTKRNLNANLIDLARQSQILHLSSFTGAAERALQETLVDSIDADTILSFNPGALYTRLGADRLSSLLTRTNVLFLYEQQLDELLSKSSADVGDRATTVSAKMARLYDWRNHRGSNEPMAVAVKRPVDLVRGRAQDYLAVGYGRTSLEDFAGPDAGARRREVLDSTGAGDALAAGFLFGLLKQSTPHECANLAFVMALSASSGLGARIALPRRRDLAARWRLHLPGVTAPAWLIDDDEQPRVS